MKHFKPRNAYALIILITLVFLFQGCASVPVTGEGQPLMLTKVEPRDIDGKTEIAIESSAPIEQYTSFQLSDPQRLVIDITDAQLGSVPDQIKIPGSASNITLSQKDNIVRVEIGLSPSAGESKVYQADGKILVELAKPVGGEQSTATAEGAAASAPAAAVVPVPPVVAGEPVAAQPEAAAPAAQAPETAAQPQPEQTAAAPAQPEAVAAAPATPVEAPVVAPVVVPVAAPAPSAQPATVVSSIKAIPGDKGVTVVITGNGGMNPKTFTLQKPTNRIVIDIPGVQSKVKSPVIKVGKKGLDKIRVGQYGAPDAKVRVVLDITKNQPFTVTPDGDTLVVALGVAAPPVPSKVAEAQPAPAPPAETAAAPAAAPVVAAVVPETPAPAAPAAEAPVAAPAATEAAAAPVAAPVVAAVVPETSAPAAPAAEAPVAAPAATEAAAAPKTEAPAAVVPVPAETQPAKTETAVAEPVPSSNAAAASKKRTAGVEAALFNGISKYAGRKISLDLQDADLVNVMRLFAEVANLNIILAPDVRGKVTVRMVNVPWDQAMDIILKMNGLGYALEDNVLRIATIATLTKEADDEMKAKEAKKKAEDLITRIIPINFTTASLIEGTIKKSLSPRGETTTDVRTNTLIVKDIARNVDEVVTLIKILDKPIAQVMIEARIVEASLNFTRQFGIQWGGAANFNAAHGNATGLSFPNSIGVTGAVGASASGNYVVNMPANVAQGSGGAVSMTFGSISKALNLDLVLSALESTGEGKIISSPKVSALDNKEAKIEQGLSIPYSTISASGTSIQFIDAKLALIVTPHVTPDNRIFLKITATKNAPDLTFPLVMGMPAIRKNEASTEILLSDGETAVIGGILTLNRQQSVEKVPFLGDIPLIGWLFKSKKNTEDKGELMIFLTPRVLKQEAI
jgi:type IV pilus assembly protein PilQ